VPDFLFVVPSKPSLPWIGWATQTGADARRGTQVIDTTPAMLSFTQETMMVGAMDDDQMVVLFDPRYEQLLMFSGTTIWNPTTNTVSR
jgi:hypothetical protein